jgi:putative sporulation protein YtxC
MTEWNVVTDDITIAKGLGEFLAHSVPGEWTESRRGTRVSYVLACADEEWESLAWPLARAMAQYLLMYGERSWLQDMVGRRYPVLDIREQRRVVRAVLPLLHTGQERDLTRLDVATTSIYSFLRSNSTLVVEGVRTFLLQEIRREFEDAIDQAVDARLMEQEYEEFIHVLRQLVMAAKTRHEWIHVWFVMDRFYFEDAAGRRIGDDLLQDMTGAVDNDGSGLDDVLISALVTLAPLRITIHQGHIAQEGRDTLVKVFDGRVIFCRGCVRCHSALDRDRRSF